MAKTGATLLSWNDDVTPFARRRDAAVRQAVERDGGSCLVCRDHVVFGSEEIRTGTGTPYAVYTPYRNAWWKRWHQEPRHPRAGRKLPPPIPGFPVEGSPQRLLDPAHKAAGGAADRRRGRRPPAPRSLPRRRGGALRRRSRSTRHRWHLASLALPALRRALAAPVLRASGERLRGVAGCCQGHRQVARRADLARVLRGHPRRASARAEAQPPRGVRRAGLERGSRGLRGVVPPGVPATRSWTRACASCRRRVGCTTVCA